jgi:hypothetical protein
MKRQGFCLQFVGWALPTLQTANYSLSSWVSGAELNDSGTLISGNRLN